MMNAFAVCYCYYLVSLEIVHDKVASKHPARLAEWEMDLIASMEICFISYSAWKRRRT